MVNTKCKAHSNPERWDRTLKLQSPEEGGGHGRRVGKSTEGRKQVAALQSRRVLWIMGDNVSTESQWCWISFFMDSIAHFFLLLFFLSTAINNTHFHAIWRIKITALSSWNYSWNYFSSCAIIFLNNDVISFIHSLNSLTNCQCKLSDSSLIKEICHPYP